MERHDGLEMEHYKLSYIVRVKDELESSLFGRPIDYVVTKLYYDPRNRNYIALPTVSKLKGIDKKRYIHINDMLSDIRDIIGMFFWQDVAI